MLPFDQPNFRTFLQVGDQPRIPLRYYPDWKELGFAFIRDKNIHSVYHDVSLTKVRFVGTDCHHIRKALYETGFNAQVRFIIEMLDRDEATPSTTLYQYHPFFSGVLVMTEIEDEHITEDKGAEYVDASVRSDGLTEMFLNNLDTEYEIKPYNKKLLYDRLIVNNRGAWINSAGNILLFDGDKAGVPYYMYATLGLTALGEGEQPAAKMMFVQQNQGEPLKAGDLPDSKFAYSISPTSQSVKVQVRLKGSIDVEVYTYKGAKNNDIYSYFYYIYLYKNDTAYIIKSGSLDVYATVNSKDDGHTRNTTTNFDINWDRNVSLQNGDSLRIGFKCKAGYDAKLPSDDSPSTSQVLVKPTLYLEETMDVKNVEVTYSAKNSKQTTINVADGLSFIKQLCDKATEADTSIVDAESLLARVVLTSTSAMRDGGTKAIVSASVNDLISSLRKIFGFGYEFTPDGGNGKPKIDIKPIAQFYQKGNKIASVGSAYNLQIRPYEEVIFNRVNVGYDGVGVGETNDMDEFNCKMEFALHNTYSNKAMDLVSKYRADMYGIENKVREILDNEKTTTSTDADNDVWIIDADKSNAAQYLVYRNNMESNIAYLAAGGSAFNVFLSPKRMLYRNSGLAAGAVYPYNPTGILATYVSSERKTGMYQRIEGVDQLERYDFQNKGLNPLYLPFLFTFYTHYDVQLISKLRSNPYGYIEFEWEGVNLKGFIYDTVKVSPSVKKEVEWHLIAHPDMDMKTILTRYSGTGRLQSL
jgi:hypothetical protein